MFIDHWADDDAVPSSIDETLGFLFPPSRARRSVPAVAAAIQPVRGMGKIYELQDRPVFSLPLRVSRHGAHAFQSIARFCLFSEEGNRGSQIVWKPPYLPPTRLWPTQTKAFATENEIARGDLAPRSVTISVGLPGDTVYRFGPNNPSSNYGRAGKGSCFGVAAPWCFRSWGRTTPPGRTVLLQISLARTRPLIPNWKRPVGQEPEPKGPRPSTIVLSSNCRFSKAEQFTVVAQ